jgi:hypothetical protein
LQQPDCVVVAKHAHRNASVPCEISNTEHTL